MTIPNGKLTDAQLIVKAKFLLEQNEGWLYQLSLLSEIKKALNQRVVMARERKDNYKYAQERTLIDHEHFVINAMIESQKHELMFVIAELYRRALCKPGDHFVFLGVYEHGL